jgi:hypothetical protein
VTLKYFIEEIKPLATNSAKGRLLAATSKC